MDKKAEHQMPLAFTIHITRDTPRKNPREDEDEAVCVQRGGYIAIAVLDGATGYKRISYFDKAGIAPGKLASSIAGADFRSHGVRLPPVDAILSMNHALQKKMEEIRQQSPNLSPAQITQVCSALGIVARIDTRTGILSCAYPRGDCTGLIVHADGSTDWLNPDTTLEVEYDGLRTALELFEKKEIATMTDLTHPSIVRVIEAFHAKANSSAPDGFGSLRGSPDGALCPHIYEREVQLRPGDKVYLCTDGAVSFPPRECYDGDPQEGLRRGREFQRAFVEAALREGGPAELQRRIRILEQNDPMCTQYPRLKSSDDMRIIEVRCNTATEESSRPTLPVWIPEQTRQQILKLCADAESNQMTRGEFQEKFIRYCEDFFWEHRHEMQVLREGDVLAPARVQHERGVWNNAGVGDGIWIGAGMHTITAGLIAQMVAKKMGLTSDVVLKAGSAGILHDWYKKWEIATVGKAEQEMSTIDPDWKTTRRAEGSENITSALNRSKEEDARRLQEAGIPADVIELAGANLLKDDAGVLTPEKLRARPELAIIAYIDSMLRGTELLSREERMKPVFNPQSIWSLFSEGSRQEYGGKTFHEFGDDILPECFRVMAERMGFSGTETEFPAYLQKLLIDEVKST